MRTLVLASLRHYRGVHVMVVLGVAVAVAVLAGALIVGASVRASLRELALARLGNTQSAMTAPTYFTEATARGLDAVPLIATTGSLLHDGSGRLAGRVQVFGVDDAFMRFHGVDGPAPSGRDVWISEGLAAELNARAGDSLIVSVAKPSDIPLATVQGRRDQAGERLRMTVARVADRAALGEFSLTPSQGPALTVLMPLERLQRDLTVEGRVNAALSGEDGFFFRERIHSQLTRDDRGLRLRTGNDGHALVVESRAGIMGARLADAIRSIQDDVGATAEPVLVHLANTIAIGDRYVPYSLVAGRASVTSGIVLNEWAASELAAKAGDTVSLEYYLWSDSSGLETRSTTMTVSAVIPMTGEGADSTLTPEYPGLTDAEDVSGWDPPFPLDLKKVRPQDEDYWDRWRGAPKAFVPLETAQRLWGTTHGNISSIRFAVPPPQDRAALEKALAGALTTRITPEIAGIDVRDVRSEALAAAEGTTDFGEYFFYFSFFLVVAGLLLAALFFALSVEQRTQQIGLLTAAGFTARDVARVLGGEASLLAVIGSTIGIAGAVGYAAAIMYGLRTWWRDAVGTSDLLLHVDWPLLVAAAIGAFVASLLSLGLALRAALARTPRSLLSGVTEPAGGRSGPARRAAVLSLGALLLAVVLLAVTRLAGLPDAAGFFGAGGLLMIAGLLAFNWWLRVPAHTATQSVVRFGAGYARWRPTRSVLSASLIAFACFVIVSVGAFRRDTSSISLDRSAGTGGFALLAESIAPLMHNPNTASGREELGLSGEQLLDGVTVSRFRLRPGDDTSCLTLYQPRNPRIIAPEDAFIEDSRFAFASSMANTDEERANPWRLLRWNFSDGAIPAIADQTSLMYVFHLAVGDDYTFTADDGSEVRLRIVGALADSMLQSELIIGEQAFERVFPRREGYNLWMIESQPESAATIATLLEDRLSDYGLDAGDTRARWAAYHRVENTYLSTFQALGALGLLVGTLGLAAVLARNVLERRRELGLLRAVGFTPANMRTLVLSESLLLVGAGLLLGSITAVIAVVPALAERATAVPVGYLGALLLTVTTTALVSSILAARVATAPTVVSALKND
jgi:ABC-type antimicrobial peptide transport system permease subunit